MQPDLLVVDLNCAGVEADADRAEVGSCRRHRNAARDSTFQRLPHKLVSVYSAPRFMYERLQRAKAGVQENCPSRQRSSAW